MSYTGKSEALAFINGVMRAFSESGGRPVVMMGDYFEPKTPSPPPSREKNVTGQATYEIVKPRALGDRK
jgi:hypothetical protein